jgi:hypothetical protein
MKIKAPASTTSQTNATFYQPFYVTFCTGTRIMKRAPNTTLLLLENPEDGTATIR